MSKKTYVISGLLLAVLCAVGILLMGRTLAVRTDVPAGALSGLRLETENGDRVIRIISQEAEDGCLTLTVAGNAPGREFLSVMDGEDALWGDVFYVHRFGLITQDSFFGRCRGAWLIPMATVLYLVILLFGTLRRCRADMGRNLYQYRNVRHLGLILFLAFLLLDQLWRCIRYRGLGDTVRAILESAGGFALLSLPVVFLPAVVVTVSNLRLMRKEGRSWRNMLGAILGAFLCLGILFPVALGEWLQRTTLVDVHNMNGAALYVELFVEAAAGVIVAYVECVLAGTVILGIRAARRVPAFDKDYILIHGCQIRPDGSLTNLLKGRADRAVEFARMQKEATGRDIIFVPSGGRGGDEIVSEAAAISAYLRSIGVPEERILPEDRSMTTRENLRNAAAMIEARGGGRIAFSTTNYHVLRTGLLATGLGIAAEGIGSPTKSYFWINAFIREFVATLHMERKAHLRTVALLMALAALMVGLIYINNNR